MTTTSPQIGTVALEESDKGLPDATLDYDGTTYVLVITGLSGLVELPRFLRSDEEERGIVSLDPPTVQHTDHMRLPDLMLGALEIVTPAHLLEPVDSPSGPNNDPTQVMLAHLARLVSRLVWKLEPPS